MFLIYEDKEKDMFSVKERISLTGNLVDPNCISFLFLISIVIFISQLVCRDFSKKMKMIPIKKEWYKYLSNPLNCENNIEHN